MGRVRRGRVPTRSAGGSSGAAEGAGAGPEGENTALPPPLRALLVLRVGGDTRGPRPWTPAQRVPPPQADAEDAAALAAARTAPRLAVWTAGAAGAGEAAALATAHAYAGVILVGLPHGALLSCAQAVHAAVHPSAGGLLRAPVGALVPKWKEALCPSNGACAHVGDRKTHANSLDASANPQPGPALLRSRDELLRFLDALPRHADAQLSTDALGAQGWAAQLVAGGMYSAAALDAPWPDVSSERLAALSAAAEDWAFCAPGLSRAELLCVALLILRPYAEAADVPLDALRTLLLVLEGNYCARNAYHNFTHAVDVLQCAHVVLRAAGGGDLPPGAVTWSLGDIVSGPHARLAVLLAAVAHDVGHPGLTNAFLVAHEAPVALLYNDCAVLESMHAATFFAMARHPRCNIGARWSRDTWRAFRATALAAVLGTDMAQHFRHVSALESLFGRMASGCAPTHEDAIVAAVGAVKIADICNVVRPFGIARRWGFHLVCEFCAQGDWEALAHALPGGPLPSPVTARPAELRDLAAAQRAFISGVARPLFALVASRVAGLRFLSDALEENARAWAAWTPADDAVLAEASFGALRPQH